eukprot:scaffold64611_cov26-Prasinocladus_malaysianus.AAC.2
MEIVMIASIFFSYSLLTHNSSARGGALLRHDVPSHQLPPAPGPPGGRGELLLPQQRRVTQPQQEGLHGLWGQGHQAKGRCLPSYPKTSINYLPD